MYTLEQIGEFYKEMGLTSLSIKDGDFEISLSSQQTGYIPAPVMPAQPVPTVAEAMAVATVVDDGLITIYSPMVGIYDGSPQLKKGDVVRKGDIVGTIEAMKMLNDITASQDGIVEEICAAKGDMVEYNQPLIKLKPMV
ncbi:MAG: acetyl-CoA carboxylase biotin carboxyl carrier protein [Lachnospiraceae bacterium]